LWITSDIVLKNGPHSHTGYCSVFRLN